MLKGTHTTPCYRNYYSANNTANTLPPLLELHLLRVLPTSCCPPCSLPSTSVCLFLPLSPSSPSPPTAAAVPVLLILSRVLYVQARQLSASKGKKKHMSYVVKWGRERLHFPLPPPETKLAAIRRELADYTQLPPDSFKLIHAGAVMKDDNAPISAYGIKSNSTIALIGGSDPPAAHAPKKKSDAPISTPRTEESTITQIHTELDRVRTTLLPSVDSFLGALSPTAPTPAAASEKQFPGGDSEQEHIRLGELLLQSLLRLDAINAEGEWESARAARKGAVKEVQALLDRLDGGWRARPTA